MKDAFTIIELLIVIAVIAALISAMVPIGIMAIDEAKALTVANNLSQISIAIMQDFYLNHEIVSNIDDLNSYFGDQSKLLNKYAISITNSSL
ncbi:MAG: type II secretion system protein [Athalassotoga sp.]